MQPKTLPLKTKKKTYLLLVLVIAVWGTIAYKIIVALNPEVPEVQPQAFVSNKNYKIETAIDTFSIATVNRDPFLGTYTVKKTPKSKAKPKVKPVQWMPITYHGSIKNGESQMFIVSINGKQQLLKKGQVKDEVKLLRGTATTVTMRYKNASKTFKLKQ